MRMIDAVKVKDGWHVTYTETKTCRGYDVASDIEYMFGDEASISHFVDKDDNIVRILASNEGPKTTIVIKED